MVNKVILIGNLGADPELRYTKSGIPVANLRVATNEQWKDKDGQKQEQTEWHNVVAWNRLGEVCNEYLNKGSKVYVEGKLQTRKWQDQNGNDRYTTDIIASTVQFLSTRGEGGGGNYGGGDPGPSEPPGGGFSNTQDSNSYAGDGGDSYSGGMSSGQGSSSADAKTGGSSTTGSDVPF